MTTVVATALPTAELRIIRKPELELLTGLSSSEIDKLEARGKFPRRVSPTPRIAGWIEHEIRQWLLDRMQERDDAVRTEELKISRMPPGQRYRYLRERVDDPPDDAPA